MDRIYAGGRSCVGYSKGRRITSLAHVEVGDVLLTVDHQFEAQNLCRVTSVNDGSDHENRDGPTTGFRARFIRPELSKKYQDDFNEFFVHDFELSGKSGTTKVFYRSSEPKAPTS